MDISIVVPWRQVLNIKTLRTELPYRTCTTRDQNRFVLILAGSLPNWYIEPKTPELKSVHGNVVSAIETEGSRMEAEWDSSGFVVGDSVGEL